MILECKLYCVDSRLEEFGVATQVWLKMAVDLRKVELVKEAELDDGTRAAALYLHGEEFVVNMMYDDIFPLWKRVHD